jgi:histidinol dehydrogenase
VFLKKVDFMKIVKVKPNSAEIKRLCSRAVAPTKEIQAKVDQILLDVRTHGLPKVIEYAKAYDGLKGNRLIVSESVIEKAAQKNTSSFTKGLKTSDSKCKSFPSKSSRRIMADYR